MSDTNLPEPGQRDDDADGQEPGLPEDLERFIAGLTGGSVPPEVVQMLQSMGVGDLDASTMSGMISQFQAMFAASSDAAVDADQAMRVIAQVLGHLDTPSDDQAYAVTEAVRLAGLWLDQVTRFGSPSAWAHAWNRAEWAEETLPTWIELVTPVAEGMSSAIATSMERQLASFDVASLPEELRAMLPAGVDPSMLTGQVRPMMSRMTSAMFSVQVGQAVAELSGDILTGSEVGLPLVDDDRVVLLPAAIDDFAEGLQLDPYEVRAYVAVRELARCRLFSSVPWVSEQVLAAVRDYARDIAFDTDAIEDAVRGLDPSDPEGLSAALQDSVFSPTPSAVQQAALERLETWLALIEGWVDVVTDAATAGKLPHTSALGEAMRRRRAGGPSEKTFRALVGLDLRPRRMRDAANLFRAVESAEGADARDSVWTHPDLAPVSSDLDDPMGYAERRSAPATDDLDAELARLIDESSGDDPTPPVAG